MSWVVAISVATDAETKKKARITTRNVLNGFSTSARKDKYFWSFDLHALLQVCTHCTHKALQVQDKHRVTSACWHFTTLELEWDTCLSSYQVVADLAHNTCLVNNEGHNRDLQ